MALRALVSEFTCVKKLRCCYVVTFRYDFVNFFVKIRLEDSDIPCDMKGGPQKITWPSRDFVGMLAVASFFLDVSPLEGEGIPILPNVGEH